MTDYDMFKAMLEKSPKTAQKINITEYPKGKTITVFNYFGDSADFEFSVDGDFLGIDIYA